ncbi:MAG: ATP-binding protein, partial [Thermoflexaceae bacterium]|nr:ATP-binding protein [Thermoflexaceae bacterium]
NLESAIEHLNPQEQDGVVSTGNKDLEGVEIAINNLLARMRESYRQQSRFVSDASHELRTPIAVIQGYANMLDRWGKDDEKVLAEGIEAIKHESEHMKTLVEQLLFLARSDAGRNHLDMQQISLKAIIHEVYEESVMIDEKHQYELVENDGDVTMTGDAAMIKQSVRILVDNAAKYTQEGETIILKSGINKEMKAYFSIQDNGIGMNSEEVSHVFERFYRSDEARNRQTGGTGLGLSIAKWIIDKHNGYFDVLSRPEIGTRFTVTFQ